jgi:predicted RNase H-like HicB family nuclease
MIREGDLKMELTANIHSEDGSYWADVPKLPGCFASGDTLDELFDSLREGVRLYMDDAEIQASSDTSLQLVSAVLSDAAKA